MTFLRFECLVLILSFVFFFFENTTTQLFQYPGSFDNVRISDDGSKLLIQEDLDNEPELSRILLWDLETEQYEEVAAFDGEIFYPGGDSFLTTNEESSGIISLEAILGPGYYALSAQVHTSVGLSDPDTQVEYGQILIMQIDEANRQTDVLRTVVIDQYASFAYKVDGLDPPIEWTSPDYTFDPTWVTANGTAPLGYGEAPGILNTDVGQPETPRPLAYYFRTTFDLPSTEVVGFNLLMRLDDGAVVYINGVEVLRQNVPLDSDVSNTTAAITTEEGEDQWKVRVSAKSLHLDIFSTFRIHPNKRLHDVYCSLFLWVASTVSFSRTQEMFCLFLFTKTPQPRRISACKCSLRLTRRRLISCLRPSLKGLLPQMPQRPTLRWRGTKQLTQPITCLNAKFLATLLSGL